MPSRTPIVAGLGLLVVLALAILVSLDATDAIDRAVFDDVRSFDRDGPLSLLRPITELASTEAMWVLAAVAVLIGVAVGPWRQGLLAAFTIGLTAAVLEIVKAVVARERPEVLEPIIVERGFSFPSGHATLGMTAYGVLAVLIARSRVPLPVKVGAAGVAALLVVAVGVSRVWLGVHFPTDVVAGWTMGAVVVLLFADLTRGVSTEPAAAAADEGRGAPRSDPPAAG